MPTAKVPLAPKNSNPYSNNGNVLNNGNDTILGLAMWNYVFSLIIQSESRGNLLYHTKYKTLLAFRNE